MVEHYFIKKPILIQDSQDVLKSVCTFKLLLNLFILTIIHNFCNFLNTILM